MNHMVNFQRGQILMLHWRISDAFFSTEIEEVCCHIFKTKSGQHQHVFLNVNIIVK